MPKQRERGWETTNVLAPHVAAFFKLIFTKANVPRAWKEAKLTPVHKKKLVTIPENYRISYDEWDTVQASGFMPICYVPWSKTGVPNTTRSRTHNLIFISTLHLLFILQHLKDAAQKIEGLISAVHSLH
jgi:hypothetical protein